MHKIKHRKQCPCGSGKKYKKCCSSKKPRKEVIYATTAGKVTEISIDYDFQNDEIKFGGPMIRSFNQTYYERESEKGPKILNQTPIKSGQLRFSSDAELGDGYDLLFAIDTNTKPINKEIVSVSGIILGEKVVDPKCGKKAIKWSTPFCMEFLNVNVSQERLAWKMLIEHILVDERLRSIPRIGIIVDSDFQNITAFNERTSPIIWDFYLPDNTQLIYATADGGSEYISNYLLQQADKISSKILKMIEAGSIQLSNKIIQGKAYSSYRKFFSSLPDEELQYKSLRKAT